ncbi:MAG: hypothetical protein A3J97_16770, partial [Spirochaetes bacterium RIFOXYC1_FULL_54_7]
MPYTGFMTSFYHHTNLRASLLAEGRRLLLAEGYAHFSLRKLASVLGVSHNAPYRHFASREKFIKAIVEEDAARFDAALAAGVEGVGDAAERLYRLGDAYVFFFLDNPEVLLLFETLPGQVALRGEILASLFSKPGSCAQGEGAMDGYELLTDAAQPFAGRFPGLEKQEIALGYWAKVHGLASLLVAKRGLLPEDSLRDRVRMLVRTPF